MLTLVMDRSEIDKYADRNFRQSHIVPKLLTLLVAQSINGLALNQDTVLAKEIHVMLVLEPSSVEVYREIVFLRKCYTSFLEENVQSFLVHVLIQEWAKLTMHLLETTIQIITELLQF